MSAPGDSHGRVSGGHAAGGCVVQRALVEEPVPAPRVGHRPPRHGQARRALQQNKSEYMLHVVTALDVLPFCLVHTTDPSH